MKNPCHSELLPSVKRIEGQIRGITKMIEEEKYCIDILNQIKAAKNALTTVEGKVLKTHLKMCVKDALVSEEKFDEKVEEILKILKR